MNKLEVFYKVFMAGVGAVFGYLYGSGSPLLVALLTFAVIDYFTGWIAAGVEGKLSSKVGFKGIAKKVMMFAIVAVGHIVDIALGGQNDLFRDAVIFFYLGNELLSIVENAGRTGLPVPDKIQDAIAILQGKGKGDSK